MNKELLFYKDYSLPSKGLSYNQKINSNITLRGMTKEELNKFIYLDEKSNNELSKIIDNALEGTLNISSINLNAKDFEFLLFKIRILSFGYDYKEESVCPYCHTLNEYKINLSGLDVIDFTEETYNSLTNINLPKSNHNVKIKLLSIKELLNFDSDDYNLFILSSIEMIDDKITSNTEIKNIINSIGLYDKRILNNAINKLNGYYGIKKDFLVHCGKCHKEYKGYFSHHKDFFNPKIENE